MEEFNSYIQQQEKLGKSITALYSNMKKDGPSRKTVSYFNIRLTSLENDWAESQLNHNAMCELNVMTTHKYFSDKYFDQMKEMYMKSKTYIQEYLNEIQPNGNDEENSKSTQVLQLKRQKLKIKHIQQTSKIIEAELTQEKSKVRYESLLNKLGCQWDAISNLNEEIEINEESHSDEYFTNNCYANLENECDVIMEKLQNRIYSLSNHVSGKAHIPLPQIRLPIFSGSYEEWTTFADLFQRIVHTNVNLSNAEKMHYLKTYVQGEPSRLIQHLNVTEKNYEAAWTLLKGRYENKRLILSKLLNKILDLPKIQYESAYKLKQLHDTIVECLQAINNLGVEISKWGPIVCQIIINKWDNETSKLYEQSLTNPNNIQDYDELIKFLQKRFQALESIDQKNEPNSAKHSNIKCGFCQQNHMIYYCKKFIQLEIPQRIQAIKERKLCSNCLMHEDNKKCTSKNTCKHCQKFHNSLLHKMSRQGGTEKFNGSNPNYQQISTHMGANHCNVLLATALIRAKNKYGRFELFRVLIDPGSQASFITEQAAQLLSLPRQKIIAEIKGLGEGKPSTSSSCIDSQLVPRFPSHFMMNTNLIVLSKITQSLPNKPHSSSCKDNWKNHILADPTFNIPGPIDILLGASDYSKILLNGFYKNEDGLLGQNTEFGVIISGTASNKTKSNLEVMSMIGVMEDDQLQKFWEIEDISSPRELTPEERECEAYYEKTTERNTDGRYTVKLPFKKKINDLGESRSRAVARLLQLEKKLNKDEKLKMQYHQFMKEYLNLGHMRCLSQTEGIQSMYYIPHHAVTKEDSTTTKLRVVFDASSRTTTGENLNEAMFTGPRLQQELTDVLLRWRFHKIAFTADIEKMYRQIHVNPDDQRFQRILWRFDTKRPIQEFALTTVTYGTSSAPYLAVRTLQQLAIDEIKQFPKAAEITLRDFYVDDVLSGADNVEDAVTIQKELINMLKKGGFLLRKWSSNHVSLINHLPEELQDNSALEISEQGIKKSLGIYWDPSNDTFHFKHQPTHENKMSKRNILSQISRLYDPLGWLQPVVVSAKMLIQQMWLQKLDWDQEIPNTLQDQWRIFYEQLQQVEEVTIPRWTRYLKNRNLELHGFCDASEKAYGAVLYTRVISSNGSIHVSLLIAKSKVAPVSKKTTLPRLELCAAELLAKLIKKTIDALDIKELSIFAWTDSMIALGWIRGDAQRWKTFIANRVSKIQTLTHVSQWNHVKGAENPADLISRGVELAKLKDCSLWWQGPSWLLKNKWPTQEKIVSPSEELRSFSISTTRREDYNFINQFSSFTKMIRVIAYCRRFIYYCKKHKKNHSFLTVQELEVTLCEIIKNVQRLEYFNEISKLEKKEGIDRNSKLLSLTPFLDENGLLRVGGRLENSVLSFDEKHPIILSPLNHLTKLIINNAHLTTLHGGIQATQAYIKRKYWIVNGKKQVASVINKCVKCIRFKAQTAQQLMGNLPRPRVTPSSPFTHTGIDYAGPIQVRATKGRGHRCYKGYISIFVCFSTKAIHLEVVSDMTTESFMAAYKRFTSRRGSCSHIYSDNGTTFIGASLSINEYTRTIGRT